MVQSELSRRILSAIALIAAALALTYWGIWSFVALVALGITAMCWEWGQLVRGEAWDGPLAAHVLAVWTACGLTAAGLPEPAVLALLIGSAVVGFLRFGRAPLVSLAGVLYVGLPAIILIWLRSGELWGFSAVLLVLLVVWSCDTLAYAAGRTFGGPKLWPAVSPKKTWSGFIGGIAAAAAVAGLFGLFLEGASAARLVLIGLALGTASQLGDLGESALKRAFDVKDSSGLIPGHGGFLDRLDGLVTAALMSALIVFANNPSQPARSLLFGQ